MFGIRKKVRGKAQAVHRTIRELLSPLIARLGDRLRLSGRIRLANIWARKHPRTLMFNYSAFAVLLLGITLLSDSFGQSEKQEDPLSLKSIPSMSHRLQSLSNTEIQNERIKREVAQFGQMGMRLYNELDSLLKLPTKTHEDSLRIATNYKILNDTFNKNDGHELKKD